VVWLLVVNVLALGIWYPAARTGLADEPGYQRMGGSPLATILSMDPNWPIPYAVWYHALEATGLTGRNGFMATSVVLSLTVSLLIYRYAVALSGNGVAALFTASTYTISFVNIGCWSKVGAASMVPVLPVLIYGLHDGWRWRSRVAMTLGVLCASYFRPEMAVAAVMAALWMLAGLWGRDRPWLRVAGVTVGIAGLVGVLHAAVGLPLVTPSGRPSLALSQHFALNWVRWTGYSGNPWLDHAVIWNQVFGTSVSHVAALGANPTLMLRHLADNAIGLVIRPLTMVFVSGAHRLPIERISLVHASGLVLLAVLIATAARSWPAMPDGAWLRAQLVPWAILVVPTAIAGILIYPRHHATAWISVILLAGTWAVIGRGATNQRRLAAFGVAFTLTMAAGAWLLGALPLLHFLRG
jgi:hypothetical protein